MQGSRELAGFLDLEFWTRTVLEQSHQESVVRQALVSLSSLHLGYTTNSSMQRGMARDDALMQYGKALRMLQRRMKTPDADTTRAALVCSILFYCFEAMLGHSEAATDHLQGGINLLSHWQSPGMKQCDDVAISHEFERLEFQNTLFYDQSMPTRTFSRQENEERFTVRPFHRLGDAHCALGRTTSREWRLICDNLDYRFSPLKEIPEPLLREKSHLQEALAQWKLSFDVLEDHRGRDNDTTYQHRTLLVHWHIACMLLDAMFPANPDVWGVSPNPRAAEILRLIEDALAHEQRLWSRSESTQFVTSEMGVIAPLFAVALRCADQEASTRAYELLCSMQRREGQWEGSHMASIVSKLRTARTLRYMPQGEAALAAAHTKALDMLSHNELESAESVLSVNTKSPLFEKSVEELWASFRDTEEDCKKIPSP